MKEMEEGGTQGTKLTVLKSEKNLAVIMVYHFYITSWVVQYVEMYYLILKMLWLFKIILHISKLKTTEVN